MYLLVLGLFLSFLSEPDSTNFCGFDLIEYRVSSSPSTEWYWEDARMLPDPGEIRTIRIKFWIIKLNKTDFVRSEYGGPSTFQFINEKFISSKIQFQLQGIDTSIVCIDCYWGYKNPDVHHVAITEGAINVYVTGGNGHWAGISSIPDSNYAVVRLASRTYLKTWVFPHELGHCFGLLHTFDSRFGKERITRDGANDCEPNHWYSGDLISDTNADVGVSKVIDCESVWKNVIDPCENTNYDPPKSNNMSYFDCNPKTFSIQQIRAMHHVIEVKFGPMVTNPVLPVRFNIFNSLNDPTFVHQNSPNGWISLNSNVNWVLLESDIPLFPGTSYNAIAKYLERNSFGHHHWNNEIKNFLRT